MTTTTQSTPANPVAGTTSAADTSRRRARLIGVDAARGVALLGMIAAVMVSYYAVTFMLAIPLVFLPTWTVAVIAVATAGGMPALSHILLPDLPIPTGDNPTVGYLADDPVGLLTELSITGEFPALPWMAYLCTGLVIGRLTLTRLRAAIGLLATGIVLAVAAWAASSILLTRYGGLAHIWAGTAIALLGVMLLAGHLTRPALRRLTTVVQAPLAAAGSMTLTLHAAHIMFINSDYDRYDATTSCLVQVVAVLLVGLVWWATVGRGPLEWLVGALSAGARRLMTPASWHPRSRLAVTAKPVTEESLKYADAGKGRAAEPTDPAVEP